MQHYLAIVEEGDADHAYGIWFPDIRGCFSGGDTFEEAMLNAQEAIALHLQLLIEDGIELPRARSLAEMKADPDVAEDLKSNIVAAIPFKGISFRPAAE
ncbi:MAG: type II toxin-antitoxin system HicB family antitoxin [Beijerinckiaceae bacterium]|nr:type II toxin-antitoxin system HicB family antitoxin [Beijerinckiaceae bacterium]